jgi:hypothetical protein
VLDRGPRRPLAGEEGTINYRDLAVNIVFGFGAVYFIAQGRKSA